MTEKLTIGSITFNVTKHSDSGKELPLTQHDKDWAVARLEEQLRIHVKTLTNMNIDFNFASQHLADANSFETGEMKYMNSDHPIRLKAEEIFSQSNILHLRMVCMEIFRVYAMKAYEASAGYW